jgi:tetratricopeptide (TPR) repeat protein
LALVTVAAAITPPRLLYKRLRLNERNPRLQIWAVALQGGKDHPFAGTGLGNFELAYQRHSFPFETDTVRYGRTTEFAHNEFLQILSDLGLPALLIVLFGVLSALGAPVAKDPGRQRSAKALFLIIAVVAFYNILWHLPIFIFLAILSARMVYAASPGPPPGRRPAGIPLLGTALILAALAVSLGWCAVRDRWASRGRWDAILRWNPRDAGAWARWADQQRNAAEAVKGYGRAVAIAPEHPYYLESYALALESTRTPEGYSHALDAYRRALQSAPHRPQNALAIGRILFLAHQPGKALGWFQKALWIEPHYWECDLWIARCLAQLNRPREARRVLRNVRVRRRTYLHWRRLVGTDLGPANEHSGYERSILAYDDRTIDRALTLVSR